MAYSDKLFTKAEYKAIANKVWNAFLKGYSKKALIAAKTKAAQQHLRDPASTYDWEDLVVEWYEHNRKVFYGPYLDDMVKKLNLFPGGLQYEEIDDLVSDKYWKLFDSIKVTVR